MKKYHVKKYFEWGSLQLEPSQDLTVTQSEIEDCWIVTRENTEESIIVSKKALQAQVKLGKISENLE